MTQLPERVISAAHMTFEGHIYTAPTHGEIYATLVRDGVSIDPRECNNGFMTDRGRFLSRLEAEQIVFSRLDNEGLLSEDL